MLRFGHQCVKQDSNLRSQFARLNTDRMLNCVVTGIGSLFLHCDDNVLHRNRSTVKIGTVVIVAVSKAVVLAVSM
jgi:hypothetical protein